MKKKIFICLACICLIFTPFFLTGCFDTKGKVNTISNESDFIECIQEGFPDDSYMDGRKDGKAIYKIVPFELTNDITITSSNIKNKTTVYYDTKFSDYSSEEEFMNDWGLYYKKIVLDGKNHTVKNLTINGWGASLFGVVGSSSITVKNITFDNLTIDGQGPAGGFVSFTATRNNCEINFENVHIINSSISGDGEYPLGGFVGSCNLAKGIISNCSIKNTVINGENANSCGGFIGNDLGNRDRYISIADSTSIGNKIQGKESVGGFIGTFNHESEDYKKDRLIEFKNLTCSSDVIATNKRAGGIVGLLSYWDYANFTFTNCKTEFDNETYREIKSSGYSAGGILGSANWNGGALRVPSGSQLNFVNCSNNISVSGSEYVGGISGCLDDRFWKVTYTDCKNLNYGSIYGATKLGGISGSIAGDILGAQQFTFTGCENNAFVTGSGEYVGGISGYNDNLNPLFTNCKNTSQYSWLTGVKYVGGISGRYGTFVDCENSMAIKHNGFVQTTWQYVGGIVGSGDDSTFTNCINSGNIIDYTKSTGVTATYIGGIAGFTSKLLMTGCSNSGTIAGSECVGGLVGKSDATFFEGQKNTLINCSNTGNIYAFGQTNTIKENYDNKEVKGKIGILIGSFYTGTLIFEFDNVTVNGNIYIINDTDHIGGWCGYMEEGSVDTLKGDITNSTIDYKIYLSQNVSDICITNYRYGANVFEGDNNIGDFNNPTTSPESFVYSE